MSVHCSPGFWSHLDWGSAMGATGKPPQPLELKFCQERLPPQVSPDSHFQTGAGQLFTEHGPGRGDSVALQKRW